MVISHILSPHQIKKVEAILNGQPENLRLYALKELFRSIRPQLEGRGVHPDYLAYAVLEMNGRTKGSND